MKWRAGSVVTSVLMLVACGDSNRAPSAQPLSVSLQEDQQITGQVVAADPDGDALTYEVRQSPQKGNVHMDRSTGQFTYVPRDNLNGTDSFTYQVHDGRTTGVLASVTLSISAVDDAPILHALSNVHSLRDSYDIPFSAVAEELDGEPIRFTVQAQPEGRAEIVIDESSGQGSIAPLTPGQVDIVVTASDGITSVSRQFSATLESVRRELTIAAETPGASQLVLRNTARTNVELKLGVNGLFHQSNESILAAVDASVVPASEDPFIYALWRYVWQSTRKDNSITAEMWIHDPTLFLNSVGAGLCDDRASVLAHLAMQRGYTVRMWDIEGHVVPEILVDGRWQMWDADYGVYYRDRSGAIASLAQLALDPTLITDPWSISPPRIRMRTRHHTRTNFLQLPITGFTTRTSRRSPFRRQSSFCPEMACCARSVGGAPRRLPGSVLRPRNTRT